MQAKEREHRLIAHTHIIGASGSGKSTLIKRTNKPALPAPKYDYVAPELVNPKLPVSDLDFKDPLQFWDILSSAMNENPPPAKGISALLPMFCRSASNSASSGRLKVDPIVLEAMARAAKDIQPMMNSLPFGRLTNGWFIPPPTIGDPKTDYKIRAIVARVGLTANTPKEAVYLDGMLDSDGNPLRAPSATRCRSRRRRPTSNPLLGPEDVRRDESYPSEIRSFATSWEAITRT